MNRQEIKKQILEQIERLQKLVNQIDAAEAASEPAPTTTQEAV